MLPEAILDLLGLDVDGEWIAAFGAAGSDVRGAIASGERAQEAVLIRQTELRDWSDARKQELLQVVASVDAEPWYDCSTWDVTYRLQDFGAWLGALGLRAEHRPDHPPADRPERRSQG